MTQIQKLEKKGYKVVNLTGWRNGEQTITGVQVKKDVRSKNYKSATEALRYVD